MMVATNMTKSLLLMYGSEGAYSNQKGDPGGPTKYGITIRTLAARRGVDISTDEAYQHFIPEVKNLTLDEAQQILRDEYAAKVNFDGLPNGVDYGMFDYATNSGPARAVFEMQVLCKDNPAGIEVKQDGIMGAKTLAAIQSMQQSKLIDDYCDARLAFMKGLKNWEDNKNGWKTRVEMVRDQAHAMMRGGSLIPPLPGDHMAEVVAQSAKAPPSSAAVTSSKIGLYSIVGMVSTGGVVAGQLAEQLAPLAGFTWGKYLVTGLTAISSLGVAVGTIKTFLQTLENMRNGQVGA